MDALPACLLRDVAQEAMGVTVVGIDEGQFVSWLVVSWSSCEPLAVPRILFSGLGWAAVVGSQLFLGKRISTPAADEKVTVTLDFTPPGRSAVCSQNSMSQRFCFASSVCRLQARPAWSLAGSSLSQGGVPAAVSRRAGL